MVEYLISIKDLVSQVLKNGSEIKTKAESGDALSNFQMGMIHLLGIETPIDFKKASKYFENPSLADNPNAKRLLGFIAECGGNYSLAFNNYLQVADQSSENSSQPYYQRVYEGRETLNKYFKSIGVTGKILNACISSILKDLKSESLSSINPLIKIACICEDEISCVEVAKSLLDEGDFYSAKRWLLKGKVDCQSPTYVSVEGKLQEIRDSLLSSKTIDVINVDGVSLIEKEEPSISFDSIRKDCDSESKLCKSEWRKSASRIVTTIKKTLEEEEAERIRLEKEKEAERIRQEQEAERIRQEEEAARIRREQEEEAARIRREQEEEAARIRRVQEEEAVRKRKIRAEKAAQYRKKKKEEAERIRREQEEERRYSLSYHIGQQFALHRIVYISIIAIILAIPFIVGFKFLPYFIFIALCCLSHYFIFILNSNKKSFYINLFKKGTRVLDIYIGISIALAILFTYVGFLPFVIVCACGLVYLIYWQITQWNKQK